MFYKSGIYAIINHSNGKVYIGQSVKTFTRLNTHKRQLKQGKHKNKALQEDYSRNSKQFEFKTLFNCHEDELNYYEGLMLKEAINQGFKVFNVIKSPFKDLEQSIEERKNNYIESFGIEPGEDIKVSCLKSWLK